MRLGLGASGRSIGTDLRNSSPENYPPQFIARHIIDATSHSRSPRRHHRPLRRVERLLPAVPRRRLSLLTVAVTSARPPTRSNKHNINKAQHFLSLLAPKPGEYTLELGCGWGAMMKFLRNRIGDSVTLKGITISNAQARFICQNYGFDIAVEKLRHPRIPIEPVRPHLFNGRVGTRASTRRSAATQEALRGAQTPWPPVAAVQLPPYAGDLSPGELFFLAAACPLCPRKQTCSASKSMSALCH